VVTCVTPTRANDWRCSSRSCTVGALHPENEVRLRFNVPNARSAEAKRYLGDDNLSGDEPR